MGTLIGGFLQRKEPKLGELRDPISLIRQEQLPDGLSGWRQKIKPYADVWAKVSMSNVRFSEGDGSNENSDIHHEFIIRRDNELIKPTDTDYAVYDQRMYRVRAVRDLNFKHRYWILFVQEEGELEEYQHMDNVDTPEDPEDPFDPKPEPVSTNEKFPFWR